MCVFAVSWFLLAKRARSWIYLRRWISFHVSHLSLLLVALAVFLSPPEFCRFPATTLRSRLPGAWRFQHRYCFFAPMGRVLQPIALVAFSDSGDGDATATQLTPITTCEVRRLAYVIMLLSMLAMLQQPRVFLRWTRSTSNMCDVMNQSIGFCVSYHPEPRYGSIHSPGRKKAAYLSSLALDTPKKLFECCSVFPSFPLSLPDGSLFSSIRVLCLLLFLISMQSIVDSYMEQCILCFLT